MRELEFLPAEYVQARFLRRIRFIRSYLLFALGLAMILWSLQMSFWVRDARAELQALRTTGAAVDADVMKVQMLRVESQFYNQRYDLLRALKPRVSVADVISTLVDLLPEGITLDEVAFENPQEKEHDPMTLTIRGTAPKEAVVSQLLTVLEASPQFGKAALFESKPVVAAESAERRSFAIEAKVVPAASVGGH